MSSSPSRIGISGQAGAAVKAAPFLRAGGCLDSGPGLPYRYDEEGEGAYPECVIRRGRRRLPRQRFSSTAKIGAPAGRLGCGSATVLVSRPARTRNTAVESSDEVIWRFKAALLPYPMTSSAILTALAVPDTPYPSARTSPSAP